MMVAHMTQPKHSEATPHRQGQVSKRAKRKRIESILDIEAGESDEEDTRPVKSKGKGKHPDAFLDDVAVDTGSEDNVDNLAVGKSALVDSGDEEEDVYDYADDEDYLDRLAEEDQYDDLVQRLRHSHQDYGDSEDHNNLNFPSSVRNAVMSIDTQQSFWQLNCKHGQENNLVFDIMRFAMEGEDVKLGLDYLESTPGPSEALMPPSTAWANKHPSYSHLRTSSSIPLSTHVTYDHTFFTTSQPILLPPNSSRSSAQAPTVLPATHGDNSWSPWVRKALKATKDIEEFALSSDGNNGLFADQLAIDLELLSLPSLWLCAIDSTGLDPDETPEHRRNRYLQEHRPRLLEWIVSQDSTVTLSALTEWLSSGNCTMSSLAPSAYVIPSPVLQRSQPDAHGIVPPGVYHARIFSAFAVAGLSGYICLEADLGKYPQETDVVAFLRSHPAVPISASVKQHHDAGVSRAWVHMRQLMKNQVAELLSWRPPPDIRPGQWVRITKGIYSGDLAAVVHWNVSVTAFKNSQRPAQHLFSIVEFPGAKRILTEAEMKEDTEDEIDESENRVDRLARLKKQEWTKKLACQHFVWDEDQFHFGLLQMSVPYSSVSILDITMDKHSRILFVTSGHPYLGRMDFPDPHKWVFFANDTVRAVREAGRTSVEILPPVERILQKGTVQSVESHGCRVHFSEYDGFDEAETAVLIPNGNLLKTFKVGDLVQVEGGQHKGLLGWVVSYSDIQHKTLDAPDGEDIEVHPNTCRLQSPRAKFAVPWINTHVLVAAGKQYKQHTGFIVDVSMSRKGYTMVHVDIPMAGVTAVLRHDDIVEHQSKKPLRQRFPLQAHQMQFRQLNWTDSSAEHIVPHQHTSSYSTKLDSLPRAPNLKVELDQDSREKPIYNVHSGEVLTPENSLIYQPPVCPWVGKQDVSVIKGPTRSLGTMKDMRRDHLRPSGLTIGVELYMIHIERGGNPCIEVDYTWVRDHQTGLSLAARYPLWSREAYWELLVYVSPVKPAPLKPQNTLPALPGPAFELGKTPPWRGIESMDEMSMATNASTSTLSTHWAVDSRPGEPKVVAKPNSRTGLVRITDCNGWQDVPPNEIHPLEGHLNQSHKKNRDALLVVHGEHTGKYLRPFYHDFIDVEGEKEQQLAIMAVEFRDWGEDIENRVEGFVLVRPEEYAKAAGDVNREQFKAEIKQLHDEAQARNKRPRPRVRRE
ncbi:hypothetical protein D9758_014237 [Tetrapyrgos nigripes]|uniref:KOW domain-containing protein n=1 Tax=Tetrapyrgos nigripes TaxID=182062 RepID=A0A8H5CXN8_9AGAR|nr:hypothetical protein D9758_014237 [Tetrapyrgos nigripes]